MLSRRVLSPSRSTLAVTLITITALLGGATSKALAQPDGIHALFIGHSFFRPFADEMPFHATQAGIVGHTQNVVFRGGANGAPEALWNDPVTRAEIQGYLDAGNVEVFGMTAHNDYPGLTGYINWFDYALAQNPNTRFMLALPWLPQPASYTAPDYASAWHATHAAIWHDLVDTMRGLYPGVEIFCNPYGQSALELRLLLDAGNLPGVTAVQGPAATSIHTDTLGHAGDILKDLGELVWLNVIYGVDLNAYSYSPPWATDLNAVAQTIMDAHNATYASHPIGAKKLLIKNRVPDDESKNKIVFISKDPSVSIPATGSGNDPRCGGDPSGTVKASFTVANLGSGESHSTDLPCQNWQLIGNALDPKGYKYRDKELDDGTAKTVVWKSGKLLKAVLQGKGPSTLNFDLQLGIPLGSASAVLTSGSTAFCASCDASNGKDGSDGKKFLGKSCAAPVACP